MVFLQVVISMPLVRVKLPAPIITFAGVVTMTQTEVPLRLPLLQEESLVRVRQITHHILQGGPKIKHELINNKHIFHNYGLGAAAVPLAFGASMMSAKGFTIFFDPTTAEGRCAVIGSGVLGLMTALELIKRGRKVTIYSAEIPELESQEGNGVTSQILPVVWLPNEYDWSQDMLKHQLISKLSYDYLRECVELNRYQSIKEVNVVDLVNDQDDLKEMISNYVAPSMIRSAKAVYNNGKSEECAFYKTFHLDSPLFLQELKIEAVLRGVRFVKKRFANVQEILSLPEEAIWNCTNASSASLFEEADLQPRNYVLMEFEGGKDNFVYKGVDGDKKQFELQCVGGKAFLVMKTEGELSKDSIRERLAGVKRVLESYNLKAKL